MPQMQKTFLLSDHGALHNQPSFAPAVTTISYISASNLESATVSGSNFRPKKGEYAFDKACLSRGRPLVCEY